MNFMEVVTIRGALLPDGCVAVWGETESGKACPLSTLRKLLFVWHRKSCYGTMLDTAEHEGRPVLLLSPLTALDYFASPACSAYGSFHWSDELKLLVRIAELYMRALQHGWYAPSFDAYQNGGLEWEPLLPDAIDTEHRTLTKQAVEAGLPPLSKWLHAAVAELMREDPSVYHAWIELMAEYRSLHTPEIGFREEIEAAGYFDKQDWLEAIGWTLDEAPFRTCFQLSEPEEDVREGWRLKLLLQDQADDQTYVEINSEGESEAGSIPSRWREHIQGKLARDVAKCLRTVPSLEDPYRPEQLRTELDDEEAWAFMDEGSLQLMAKGFSVMLPSWWEELRLLRPKLKAQIRSSVGSSGTSEVGLDQLLQFDWKVAVGDLDLTEEEFARAAAEKKRLMYIRGKWVQLDPAFLERIRELMKQTERKQGLSLRDVLELHLLEGEDQSVEGDGKAADLDSPERLRIQVELNNHLKGFMNRLLQNTSVPLIEVPSLLHADLRRYQQEGVSWLAFLRSYGMGGCLADDMGLGKTIQFIAYLLHTRREVSPEQEPALLICPTSVLGNWQKELERFAPSLRLHLHYGPLRASGEAFGESIRGADLVLTSYQLAHLDEAELTSVSWDAICLDEAQNIKNVYTKQAAAIRRVQAKHRIALTGTPIENRLTELWSIFDFINPGYLGSLGQFTHRYVKPIEKTGDEALTGQVQRLIRPFLLRRVKKDPAIQLDLPDKYEAKTYISLTVEQGSLYENVVQQLMEQIDTLTPMERRGLILATLLKLKQICDHPALFLKEKGAAAENLERSGKMTRLLEMVGELRDEGDSCLIFTQFVEMGHMLQSVLSREMSEPVQFLHGGLNKTQRDELVARFQDASQPKGERPAIFILSLKAGGTGLNLTAANHVFHFDRWWNPAVENQATDRAFRIGQTRDVQVHKFVALGTLEERIDDMIERKQGLSRQIVGSGENWVTELSTSELRELFALRREWIGR